MSQFRIDLVRKAQETVDDDKAWIALEGRKFGPESNYPLKIYITTQGEQWDTAWQEGCEKYAEGMSSRKRRKFAQQCTNPATMPRKALSTANRNAIKKSGCLMHVSWIGPTWGDREELDAWASGKRELLIVGDDKAIEPPKDAAEVYELNEAGRWVYPISSDTPEAWHADDKQIDYFFSVDAFNLQVGNFRREFEEEGSDDEARDLGNLPDGLTLQPVGKPSRKAK